MLTIGVATVSMTPSDSADELLFHDMSDHFFPRSMHELGTMAVDIPQVARELTKRGIGALSSFVKRSATYEGIRDDFDQVLPMNYSVGVFAVMGVSVLSGLTGVYFEKVLKDPAAAVSLWTRNVQLSLFSLLPSFLLIIAYDGTEIAAHGFFDGYNAVVWTTIVLQAVGGILVSLVISYADNIAKNFATSISILISFVCSIVLFDFQVHMSVRSNLRSRLAPPSPGQGHKLTFMLSSYLAWPWCWGQHSYTAVPNARHARRRSAWEALKRGLAAERLLSATVPPRESSTSGSNRWIACAPFPPHVRQVLTLQRRTTLVYSARGLRNPKYRRLKFRYKSRDPRRETAHFLSTPRKQLHTIELTAAAGQTCLDKVLR